MEGRDFRSAFYDPDLDNLDQMAHRLNDTAKRSMMKSAHNMPFNYFNTQGDLTNEPDQEQQSEIRSIKKHKKFKKPIHISISDTDNESISSTEDSTNDKLDHIKKCTTCKRKFMNMIKLKKEKHIFEDTTPPPNAKIAMSKPAPIYVQPAPVYIQQTSPSNTKSSDPYPSGLPDIFSLLTNNKEMTNIVLIILIGILIMIILDTVNK